MNALLRTFPLLCALCVAALPVSAQTVCAQVKIEIRQELTLERQAFDAHMRINNDLDGISLEDMNVTVNFADEEGTPVIATSDPNNSDAAFFITIDILDNITNVTGTGEVAAGTSADIHWLIVPAPSSPVPRPTCSSTRLR